jgi:tetratricopeptide (TPR) repeat protein
VRKKTRTVRSRRKQDSEGGSVAKVIKIVVIGGAIATILAFGYMAYQDYGERENLKSQIDSSLREADSLQDAELFEEAIDEYKSILKIVSSKEFPDEYAMTQNNLGNAYGRLAGVKNKEANLEKAINAFQEALKIKTVEGYPIEYATTQNNLGNA